MTTCDSNSVIYEDLTPYSSQGRRLTYFTAEAQYFDTGSNFGCIDKIVFYGFKGIVTKDDINGVIEIREDNPTSPGCGFTSQPKGKPTESNGIITSVIIPHENIPNDPPAQEIVVPILIELESNKRYWIVWRSVDYEEWSPLPYTPPDTSWYRYGIQEVTDPLSTDPKQLTYANGLWNCNFSTTFATKIYNSISHSVPHPKSTNWMTYALIGLGIIVLIKSMKK